MSWFRRKKELKPTTIQWLPRVAEMGNYRLVVEENDGILDWSWTVKQIRWKDDKPVRLYGYSRTPEEAAAAGERALLLAVELAS